MKIRNIFMITMAYLLFGAIPGFAADPSICADGPTIGKVDCKQEGLISFYQDGSLYSCSRRGN